MVDLYGLAGNGITLRDAAVFIDNFYEIGYLSLI